MKKEGLWEKGSYAETMSSADMKGKKRTFHMKHDEEMNFNCKKCKVKISAHNNDWHNGMCDECFNKQYFPEEKDDLTEDSSKGLCRLCNNEFSGKEMEKHMKECTEKRHGSIKAFLLKASEGPFWIYFSVPIAKHLADIDKFLRDVWLECCGHLSAFKIRDKSYTYDNGELEDGELSMAFSTEKVMAEGLEFDYEYDFGTATELSLECVSSINADSSKIEILSRNELPNFQCENCNNKAEMACTQCIWDGQGYLCKKCTKKHECIEPYFLPIVNSPRIGMCGFTGKECKLLNS